MVSSALGMALGLTEESTLEELKDGIIGVKDRSTTIHTAIGSGGNSDNSYYRINGSNIEVCPARGYWGWTEWEESHITIPMANVARMTRIGTLNGNESITASSYKGYNASHFVIVPQHIAVSLTAGIGGNGVNIQNYSFSLDPKISVDTSTGKVTSTGCYLYKWIGTAASGKDAKYITIKLTCALYFVG